MKDFALTYMLFTLGGVSFAMQNSQLPFLDNKPLRDTLNLIPWSTKQIKITQDDQFLESNRKHILHCLAQLDLAQNQKSPDGCLHSRIARANIDKLITPLEDLYNRTGDAHLFANKVLVNQIADRVLAENKICRDFFSCRYFSRIEAEHIEKEKDKKDEQHEQRRIDKKKRKEVYAVQKIMDCLIHQVEIKAQKSEDARVAAEKREAKHQKKCIEIFKKHESQREARVYVWNRVTAQGQAHYLIQEAKKAQAEREVKEAHEVQEEQNKREFERFARIFNQQEVKKIITQIEQLSNIKNVTSGDLKSALDFVDDLVQRTFFDPEGCQACKKNRLVPMRECLDEIMLFQQSLSKKSGKGLNGAQVLLKREASRLAGAINELLDAILTQAHQASEVYARDVAINNVEENN